MGAGRRQEHAREQAMRDANAAAKRNDGTTAKSI